MPALLRSTACLPARSRNWLALVLGGLLAASPVALCAQTETPVAPATEPVVPTTEPAAAPSVSGEPSTVDKLTNDPKEAIDDIAEQVDHDPRAQEVSAGILQPIYALAEAISIPAFHWIAFALMATGVVSFALQLVLGKLVVLMRGSMSIKEILSDALGLAISLIGLVLTTQAAAENSTFTTSPAAVLSASAVGVVAGFIFYIWGQRQELQAAKGRVVERM